ncbi:hypothetical protein JY452_09725 [Stenotrophomonas maltophilia]|uniref:hypothetical protein n=1 Tax=Stenotrophomonas TaxID=40323 RepID=UPI00122F85B3|nr:hypothetical protein [Stenotrophomonas sp. Sm3147]MBN5126271.1 hypothetical protein [Stenotrophomonas maltophilia]MBN5176413.1 hypothetical protein [Stenotrophomonas maltophilia]MDQ7276921.1 hypothetical protein [Stenotrophomonas sp. Sm3147]MDQ7284441.1 hypothetical protein [Stenotrophomonas sp. Sm5341]
MSTNVQRSISAIAERASYHARSGIGLAALAFFAAIAVALFRITEWNGVAGRMLWAEDGHVFIRGAIEGGWRTLASPYAGYLHVYPRAVSLIAIAFGAHWLAPIMAVGWLLAYGTAAVVCVQRLRTVNVCLLSALCFVVLLGILPTTSETLFTVTNAQWYLAIGLAACALLPPPERDSWPHLAFAAIASLTGPFCIIVLPVALLQAIFTRQLERRQWMLLILLVASLVQLSFFVDSDRLAASASNDASAWLHGLKSFFVFGSLSPTAGVAALVFWLCLVVALSTVGRQRGWLERDFLTTLSLLGGAGMFALAGFYAMRDQPGNASPLGFGARYFVIPYGVVLMALVTTVPYARRAAWAAIAAYLVIACMNYRTFDRPDLGYQRYLRFSESYENVFVPINPQFENFRGGFWLNANVHSGQAVSPKEIDLTGALNTSRTPAGVLVKSYVIEAKASHCGPGVDVLGVNLMLDGNTGPAQVAAAWGGEESGPSPPAGQYLAVYPGEKQLQLALPASTATNDRLRISLQSAEQAEVKRISLYCIGS